MDQKTENIFAKAVRLTMFAALAIYPFGLIPFAVWQGVSSNEWGAQRITAFAIAGAVLLCTVCIWKIVPEKITRTKTVFLCICLFCLSLSLRLFIITILQAEPFSDFLTCYEYAATGSGDTAFLARHSYLGAYALTLRLFLKVFGASVLNAQILNAVVTSCIPIALYAAVTMAIGKQNIAAMAGFIYAVCPSVIIYTAVPSCEHFSQFYLAMAVCSFAYYCTAGRNRKKRWFFCVATGILFGGVYVYKAGLAYVIVPSFLMADFCYECLPYIRHPVKKEAIKKAALAAAQSMVILLVAALLHNLCVRSVRAELGGETAHKTSAFSVGIYEGLCMEGNGVWDPDVKEYVRQVVEEHDSKGEVNRILYGRLIEQYGRNPKALLDLLRRKYFIEWCGEDYYYWTFSGDGNIVQGTWIGEVLFVLIPRIFFMLMGVVISVGLLLGLDRKKPAEEMHFLFFAAGVVFLFALALVLIEAQVRYKSNVMPLVCIVFGVCVDDLMEGVLGLRKYTKGGRSK